MGATPSSTLVVYPSLFEYARAALFKRHRDDIERLSHGDIPMGKALYAITLLVCLLVMTIQPRARVRLRRDVYTL